MRAALWIVYGVVLAACANLPATDPAPRFQAEVNRIQKQYGFPGMTAAYVLRDGSNGAAASGLADIEAKVPMTTSVLAVV